MPDIVFVRANRNAPVREGDAVSTIPTAIVGTGAIIAASRSILPDPSGQAGFAQGVLAAKNRNRLFYTSGSGDPPDNATQPIF
jgi:hypothetical protein